MRKKLREERGQLLVVVRSTFNYSQMHPLLIFHAAPLRSAFGPPTRSSLKRKITIPRKNPSATVLFCNIPFCGRISYHTPRQPSPSLTKPRGGDDA